MVSAVERAGAQVERASGEDLFFFDDCYDAKGGPWAEFGPSRRDSWGPFFGPGPDQHDEHEQDDFDPTPDAWELEGSRMPRTRSRGSGGRQRQSHSRRNRELANN